MNKHNLVDFHNQIIYDTLCRSSVLSSLKYYREIDANSISSTAYDYKKCKTVAFLISQMNFDQSALNCPIKPCNVLDIIHRHITK